MSIAEGIHLLSLELADSKRILSNRKGIFLEEVTDPVVFTLGSNVKPGSSGLRTYTIN